MTIKHLSPTFLAHFVVIHYKKYTLENFPTNNSDSSDI